MYAFHNDPAIKEKYLSRVKAHRDADRLRAGIGWKGGIGCAVGCTLEAYDHSRYPIELGIPQEIAWLEDAIFEGLSRTKSGDHLEFPTDMLTAIPVGADLTMVWPQFALWLLEGEDSPIPEGTRKHPTVADAISGVADLYREWIVSGDKPSETRWVDAENAAEAAAEADAADAASWAAAGAAKSAAAAGAARVASWVAESALAAWISMRNKLLELLAAAPVN